MLQRLQRYTVTTFAAAGLLLAGCAIEDNNENANATPSTQTPAQPAPPPPPELRLEVNLAERKLHVYRNDQEVAVHPVAVGSKEWPTPTGEWTISQVIFNPRWVPPKNESWAEDEKIAEPGDPDNPLGKVQLVYDAPNSVHGTNEPASLGKAVSHGSIRIANEAGIELAKMVMQAGGAGKDDAWVQNALNNRTRREEVVVPNPVPIRVIAGDGAAARDTTKR
ncbi:MAG TPA: L,D-transpeptidase [Longimicrobiales bacterium]